jgi:2-polyprenyl-3-methyl-5-hydroxy-6-metoxy-1,4-benzoquinol methylase
MSEAVSQGATEQQWIAENLANWNDRVPIHTGPDGYSLDKFRADPQFLSDVVSYDRERLGDLTGQRVVHLQCHIGTDTLSLARLGAHVTGVDFSGPALDAARTLFREFGVAGHFVESTVDDAPVKVGERFDLLYTGVGAINWLPSIERWAESVAELVAPGGRVFLRDAHPVAYVMDLDGGLTATFPYFQGREPVALDNASTYTGEGTLTHTRTNEWTHPISAVVMALIDRGFVINELREHQSCEWEMYPTMTAGDDGRYRLPEHQRDLIPLMFTVIATKS